MSVFLFHHLTFLVFYIRMLILIVLAHLLNALCLSSPRLLTLMTSFLLFLYVGRGRDFCLDLQHQTLFGVYFIGLDSLLVYLRGVNRINRLRFFRLPYQALFGIFFIG